MFYRPQLQSVHYYKEEKKKKTKHCKKKKKSSNIVLFSLGDLNGNVDTVDETAIF